MILSLDPGNVETAYVLFDKDGAISRHGKVPNAEITQILREANFQTCVCEMIASYGMAVGKTVFDTCVWIGRFEQITYDMDKNFIPVFRLDVKLHHCKSPKAKDSNVRQALIDRLGEPGTKAAPGGTYGIKADVWSALAIGLYAQDKSLR